MENKCSAIKKISFDYLFIGLGFGSALWFYFRILKRKKLKVKGRENLPKKGRVIYYSNHPSMMDPIMILPSLFFPRCLFQPNCLPKTLAAKENFALPDYKQIALYQRGNHAVKIAIALGWPIFRRIVESTCILVGAGRKDLKALHESADYLKNSGSILVFPEGGRTRGPSGTIGEFRRGFGLVVFEAKPDFIVPIRIFGAAEILPIGSLWPDWEKGQVTMVIGKIITPNELKLKFQHLREMAPGNRLKQGLIYGPITKMLREKLLEIQQE